MAIEHDEPEPPPKVYGFKEREFKRDNSPASPPPPSAKEHAMAAGHVVRNGPPSGGANRAADPNDVYAVLQQNRAVERKHGLNEVQIQEIKSRRKREFWLILVGGNLAIIGGVMLSGLNVVTVIFGLAGLIIFSIGLSWIMWQVMDKY